MVERTEEERSMKYVKPRTQASASFSGLVALHFVGRLLSTSFICIALIGGTGCKTRKSTEGSAIKKEFSQSDFQKLRWLEGTWRGSAGGKDGFFEGYRFINDTAIEIEFFADSTLSKVNGKGMVKLADKAIINGGGSTFWAATLVDDRSVHFAPMQNVSNFFSWEKESQDVWIARLKNTDSLGKQIETVYRMERYKPR